MSTSIKLLSSFAVGVLLCTACDKSETLSEYTLGEASYYPSFLWVDEQIEPLVTTMALTFNAEAKSANSSATLQIVDENGNVIPAQKFIIKADGKELSDGIIKVNPNKNDIKIEFIPNRSLKSCHPSGYLKVTSKQKLDRIDGEEDGIVLKWNFKYNRRFNHLALWLMWIGIVLGAILLLWICLLKRFKYPTFKRGIITISYPYYASIRVKGARKIVFTSTHKPQSFLDKLFKGKVIYHTNSAWPCDVELIPSGNNMRFRCSSNSLVSDPLPLWTRGGYYILKDSNTNTDIINLNVQ